MKLLRVYLATDDEGFALACTGTGVRSAIRTRSAVEVQKVRPVMQ
jgi:hypothetical protein